MTNRIRQTAFGIQDKTLMQEIEAGKEMAADFCEQIERRAEKSSLQLFGGLAASNVGVNNPVVISELVYRTCINSGLSTHWPQQEHNWEMFS